MSINRQSILHAISQLERDHGVKLSLTQEHYEYDDDRKKFTDSDTYSVPMLDVHSLNGEHLFTITGCELESDRVEPEYVEVSLSLTSGVKRTEPITVRLKKESLPMSHYSNETPISFGKVEDIRWVRLICFNTEFDIEGVVTAETGVTLPTGRVKIPHFMFDSSGKFKS
jgi:hypothetical protein